MPRTTRRAFTLIELLVVIAIIALLAAILFPVFARARENARRSSCQSNNKQIALGFIQYYQDYDERFPMNKEVGGGTHWSNGSLQPYLKSKQILRCPSDDSIQWPEKGGTRSTSYALNGLLLYNTDPQPAGYEGRGGNLRNIVVHHLAGVQSPAEVILLSESPGNNNNDRNYFHSFWWAHNGVYDGSAQQHSNASGTPGNGGRCTEADGNGNVSVLNNRFCRRKDGVPVPEDIATERHFGGFNVAYLDGHVKWAKWDQVYKVSADPAGSDIMIQGNFDPRR